MTLAPEPGGVLYAPWYRSRSRPTRCLSHKFKILRKRWSRLHRRPRPEDDLLIMGIDYAAADERDRTFLLMRDQSRQEILAVMGVPELPVGLPISQ